MITDAQPHVDQYSTESITPNQQSILRKVVKVGVGWGWYGVRGWGERGVGMVVVLVVFGVGLGGGDWSSKGNYLKEMGLLRKVSIKLQATSSRIYWFK